MSEEKLIPNIDYLGRCYDVVDMDPLNLGSSAKTENAIDIDVASGRTVVTRDGSYSIPIGVHENAIFSMSWETQSSVISSTHDFQQEFKQSVEVEAGVEGGFEFSGSTSHREITRQTESRKHSFVFSRAYQENHRLTLDLLNEKAPLTVTPEILAAVQQLPFQDAPDWYETYEAFVRRFGTHFTKEIILGGLAFQRTSGSAKTYLKSSETEDTLKAKASVQIEAVKAGVGAEQAQATATKSDSEFALERTSLEFRGGLGSPSGITDSWIASLVDRPAIVKAKLERLSTLLTSRFFPEEEFIDEKQAMLDQAIGSWIMKKGDPGCGTPPLRYGEALIFTLPWSDGNTIQSATIHDIVMVHSNTDFRSEPIYPFTTSIKARPCAWRALPVPG